MRRLNLPIRTINPLWRTKRYVDFRLGMPDPAREARLQRMLQLTQRR
jgi:hypothetical protein